MANSGEKRTPAALYDVLNQIKRWQGEQLREFRNKQDIEGQELLRLSSENQKEFKHLLQNAAGSESEERPKTFIPESCNVSSVSFANDEVNFDSSYERSITGHLQRCFDDSSQSSSSVNPNRVPSVVPNIPIFSELRNSKFLAKVVNRTEEEVNEGIQKTSPVKTKRPFLKKGTGLLRYQSKPSTHNSRARSTVFRSSNDQQKPTLQLPQKTLNLKPAVRQRDVSSEKVKHIRFDVPYSDDEKDAECLTETDLSSVSKLTKSTENEEEIKNNEKNCPLSPSSLEPSSAKLKDSKELEEFEMLENYAQNASFNSDSSVVQKYLQGDLNEPFTSIQKEVLKLPSENEVPLHREVFTNHLETVSAFDKIGLNKYFEGVQAKKQGIQKAISDLNPRIMSLQKEIAISEKETFDDLRDKQSSPVKDLGLHTEMPSSAIPEHDCNKDSLDLQAYTSTTLAGPFINEVVCHHELRTYDDDVHHLYSDQENNEHFSHEEEETTNETLVEEHEIEEVHDGKSLLHQKLVELQKEIDRYQDVNAKLEAMCKERSESLKKLQKERNDFNKYKEAEKKKLQAEIEEERRQIKRQKDTFMRFQKLRKDNPTRKERDEMNALRQEVEKLQEELKRQKIKYSSDSRRWKSRLDAAENERDHLKLENVKLEEQCQDLLAALKARMKKKPESKLINDDGNIQEIASTQKDNEIPVKEPDSNLNKEFNEAVQKTSETKKARSGVHFNLASKHDENDIPTEEVPSTPNSSTTHKQYPSNKDVVNIPAGEINESETVNMSAITISVESEIREIDLGNRIEKIFPSGEKEIIFRSGTRKVISADGKSVKFYFFNGDEKEIFPDRQQIYKYVNGVTEALFPDGLKVTEFPNGQIQHHYPDGRKEIKFPNGSVHKIFPDGSEEIHSIKGKVTKIHADGTKITEFENGSREIKAATYEKREYPDGSTKILYENGCVEKRYTDGRIKMTNKQGQIILDTNQLIQR